MKVPFKVEGLGLKLFSLLVAVVLFLFVSVENSTPVEVEIPIEYRLDDNIMMVGDAPETLMVTLTGPWANFREFRLEDMEPWVLDAQKAGPGTITRAVELKSVEPPPGMRAQSVSPSQVEFSLDRRVEREIDITPDIKGRPKFGFIISDVRIEPARVKVIGPAQEMQKLNTVHTREIDVEDTEESLEVVVELRPPSPPLSMRDRRSAKVAVVIREEVMTRPFQDIAIEFAEVGRELKLKPGLVTVELRGPRRIVDRMEPNSIILKIDVQKEVDDGLRRFEKEAELEGLPEGVEWVGLAPTIAVEVGRKKRKPVKK